jgi:poly(A) polymerase
VEVVERLRGAGFQAFWAGGCVRDLLMGLEPSDYDVATDARPKRVRALFDRTVAVGESFGVIKVLGPRGGGEVEVATFRTEGPYRDGRRPESVSFSTAEYDASRRDFTINGMFYDPIAERVIDYVGGQADLHHRILRAIGDPVARFGEDKLRLLRATRFAARFDLKIDPATWSAVVAHARDITQVAPERIAQELRKMLEHPSRALGMQLAWETGLLGVIFPEIADLEARAVPLGGEASVTLDGWSATRRVLERLPAHAGSNLGLAALWHLLMPELTELADGDAARAHRREAKRLAEALAARLRLANAERDAVAWHLAHLAELEAAPRLPVPRLKRLLSDERAAELEALAAARARGLERDAHVLEFLRRYRDQLPDGPINPPLLVTGNDLIACGLEPGPRFAELLEQVRDAQLEGKLTAREDALEWLRGRIGR